MSRTQLSPLIRRAIYSVIVSVHFAPHQRPPMGPTRALSAAAVHTFSPRLPSPPPQFHLHRDPRPARTPLLPAAITEIPICSLRAGPFLLDP